MGTTKKKSTQSVTKSKNSKIGREAWGIVFLGIAAFCFLSLATYNHSDPSILTHTSKNPSNFGGRVGANIAEALVQFSGMGAFVVAGLFLSFAIKLFQGASSAQMTGNLLWVLLAFVSATTLFSIEIGTIEFGGLTLSSGGLIGELLSKGLRHYFNRWGSTLITLCALLIATVFATPITAQSIYKSLKLVYLGFIIACKKALAIHKEHRAKSAEKIEDYLEEKTKSATEIIIGTESAAKVETKKSEKPKKQEETIIDVRPTNETQEELDFVIDDSFEKNQKELAKAKTPKTKPAAKPKPVDSNWTIPSLEFLKEAPHTDKEINKTKLMENSRNLEMKLAEFGISGQVVAVRPGPVITMYEFKPGAGVKISQIASRADDLSLALEAQSVRIVAPIPGKSVVGIELPNDERETVYLREILSTEEFQGATHAIPIVVGKDAAGAPIIADIASTPHLLVAGSSGAGKSVFINNLITSLLYKFTPKDLRLIMVDPKQLELALYDRIPHLLLPVVDDAQKAATALRWACNEMERRYTLMARAAVRNLKGFNQKLETEGQDKMRDMLCPVDEAGQAKPNSVSHLLEHNEEGKPQVEHLPNILVIIDEFADLMMVAKKDIENHVARLAAKARASGIHLIIATQRPSTDVITGVIKNNLPSRVAFKVPSQIDSRTILDGAGAEKLLGKGDMLFIPPGMSRLVRAHGAYVDEEEIGRICDFWRSQGEPEYREEILEEPEVEAMDGEVEGVSDPLYQQAVNIIREEGQASASRLQRRMSIGYNRAARIIESMEAQGLVGPASGSKPREVIY